MEGNILNENASQIEFTPGGRGFVQMHMRHRSGDKVVEVFHYPISGQPVGGDPIDVDNARRLNAAAESLNETLRELSS